MNERAVGGLRTLGLSLYEARLYLALLARGQQNGNELSKSSGVPSSKVYATLGKLTSVGIVSQVNSPNGAEYVCISPEELIARLRRKYDEPLDYLDSVLPEIAAEHVEPAILTLSNWEMIAAEARKIVREAEQSVRLSIWAESLDELRDALNEASERGIEVFAMIYGQGSLESGAWLQHGHREIILERIGGRMLTLVVDGRQVLVAYLPSNSAPVGIRTENPVLCLMVEEYLHHDFVLEKAKSTVTAEAWDEWWQSDPLLRDVILGRLLTHAGLESSAASHAAAADDKNRRAPASPKRRSRSR